MEEILYQDEYYMVTTVKLPRHQVINYFYYDEENIIGQVHGTITKEQAADITDLLTTAEEHSEFRLKNNIKRSLNEILKELK